MAVWQAILLGIIQGLTEFLPVSSSGHLAILKNIFGMKDVGISFDVFLHVGTLLAVFVVYWKDIWQLFINGIGIISDCCYNIREFIMAKRLEDVPDYRVVISSSYRRFTLLVIISTIPTGFIGYFGEKYIESAGDTLLIPGLCLWITACLLFISDRWPSGDKTPKRTTYLDAGLLGVAQGIATLPGVSRSGTTITAGLLLGLKREFAVKYSFIMSIPAIMGAAVLKIPDMKTDIDATSPAGYFLGMLAAAVVGYFCIKTMMVLIKKRKFTYFSIYCFLLGLVCVIASFVAK